MSLSTRLLSAAPRRARARRGAGPAPRQRTTAKAIPPAASRIPSAGIDVHEHVAEVVVALVAGQRQHLLAELRDERLLDLVLRAAVVDQALDVLALALGLGRLGGERRAACRRPGT